MTTLSKREYLAINHVVNILETVDWDALGKMSPEEQDAYLLGLQADPLARRSFDILHEMAEKARQ